MKKLTSDDIKWEYGMKFAIIEKLANKETCQLSSDLFELHFNHYAVERKEQEDNQQSGDPVYLAMKAMNNALPTAAEALDNIAKSFKAVSEAAEKQKDELMEKEDKQQKIVDWVDGDECVHCNFGKCYFIGGIVFNDDYECILESLNGNIRYSMLSDMSKPETSEDKAAKERAEKVRDWDRFFSQADEFIDSDECHSDIVGTITNQLIDEGVKIPEHRSALRLRKGYWKLTKE